MNRRTDAGSDPLDLEHVERARIPWRSVELKTECGLDAERYPCLDQEALAAKIKRQGTSRASLTTCMTCWQRAGSHPASWDQAPAEVLLHSSRHRFWSRCGGSLLDRELRAIAQLIGAHPDEWQQLLEAAEQGEEFRKRTAERERRR